MCDATRKMRGTPTRHRWRGWSEPRKGRLVSSGMQELRIAGAVSLPDPRRVQNGARATLRDASSAEQVFFEREQVISGLLLAHRSDASLLAVTPRLGETSAREVGDRADGFEMRLRVGLLLHGEPPGPSARHRDEEADQCRLVKDSTCALAAV
jgi:hypothetical protein